MTVEKLRTRTRKALADMARHRGIPGWHAMRKDQLIKVLAAKQNGVKSSLRVRTSRTAAPGKPSAPSHNHHQQHQPHVRSESEAQRGDGAYQSVMSRSQPRVGPRDLPNGYGHDRIVLMVRDPYWL